MIRIGAALVVLLGLIHASAFGAMPVDGMLGNGMRITAVHIEGASTTTIMIGIPTRFVTGYDAAWERVGERWTAKSPARVLLRYPTLQMPFFTASVAIEQDRFALKDLFASIRETTFHREFRETGPVQPAWFSANLSMPESKPNPASLVVGLDGPLSEEAMWEWAQEAGESWLEPARAFRWWNPDSVADWRFRHRAGEVASIVFTQPCDDHSESSIAALRNEINSGRLNRMLGLFLTQNRIAFGELQTGLFPPASPLWVWCYVTTPSQNTLDLATELRLAWSQWRETVTMPVMLSKSAVLPVSRSRRMEDLLRAKLNYAMDAPTDSAQYRAGLREVVRPDAWSIYVETDTSRAILPAHFRRMK